MTHDFWKSAGMHLLQRGGEGWLEVTPDYLRAYLTRPEVHPVAESNDHENRLHAALLADPFRPVSETEISAIADADAIDTYRIVLGFRDLLAKTKSVEAAYLAIVRAKTPPHIPPVFIDQMVHVILRNILDGVSDPIRLRAAELFFRDQTVATEGGGLMLADEEIVAMQAKSGESGLAQLLAETGTPMQPVALDVLGTDNAALYWGRSDRFDTVIDFRFEQPAPDAFARVVEAWLLHLMRLEVRVEPRPKLEDLDWRWHVGLDAEATRILNALYAGKPVAVNDMAGIVGLFRMRVADERTLIERVRGKPIYLGLAMTAARRMKMKPQNLLTNLPLLPTA